MVSWYSRMPGAQVHPFMVGRCARAPSRPSIAARTAPWPSLRLPQRALCSSSSRAARRPAGMGRCMPRRHTQCEPCVVASSVLPTPADCGGRAAPRRISHVKICERDPDADVHPLRAAASRSQSALTAHFQCASPARPDRPPMPPTGFHTHLVFRVQWQRRKVMSKRG